jgi:diguanylate cyclase (GGDEF)-like protein
MRVESYAKRLLYTVIVVTALGVIMEPLTWIFEGKQFVGAVFLEYSTNLLLVLLAPMIGSLMLTYVRYQLLGERKPPVRQMLFFPPVLFTALMLILNLFTPVYFDVARETNTYIDGTHRWIHYLLITGLYVYMVILTFLHRHKARTEHYTIFLLFFLLPILGMAIQLYDTEIFFSWNMIVLSILVIFLFLEAADGEVDELTTLFNRRSYETHVERLIETKQSFQVLYIDLDGFKAINDEHGHVAGDKMLIRFGELLQDVSGKSQLAARLGGDEFMVVLDQQQDAEAIAHELQQRLRGESNELLRNLQFSYGVMAHQDGMSLDDLYQLVDYKMYQYKRSNPNLRRRQSDPD